MSATRQEIDASADTQDPAVPASKVPALPGIPYGRYLDPSFYDLEIEHVFRRSWLYVGHVSDYPATGSYRITDISFAPVLVIRGKDGVLRAFLNSCQHRGATVLRDMKGTTPVMSCQYHGWSYDLTGRLIGITSPSCFPGIDKKDHALVQLRCEQWGGFVFVNLDADADALVDWLPCAFRERFGDAVAIDPKRPIRRIFRQSWEVGCNWKALVENFWESYHFHFLHPTTAGMLLDATRSEIELYRNGHGEIATPYRPPSERTWKGVMNTQDSGLPPMPGVSPELAEALNDTSVLMCHFPNLIMLVAPSGINVVSQWPTGIGSTSLVAELYVENWGDGPVPPDRQAVADIQAMVAEEDMSCMNSIQRSLMANPTGTVRLGAHEAAIYNHHVEIDRKIGPDKIRPELRVEDIVTPYRCDKG